MFATIRNKKKFGYLPQTVTIRGKEYNVVDGDLHDIRTPDFDGRGNIIGLRLKGMNKTRKIAIQSGFAVTYEYGIENYTDSPQQYGNTELVRTDDWNRLLQSLEYSVN